MEASQARIGTRSRGTTERALPRYFAVTTVGLTATRWLSYVLASHPDVYVAHGKFALDSVMRGDFHGEMESAHFKSLALGNEIRDLYEQRPLEEVFALYRGISPGARAYGCVHSYVLHTLARAAARSETLAEMGILNVVRHPVDFIASHTSLVRAAERHPRLYTSYLNEALPSALREFPELFLMPCPDYREFTAFALSCHAVSNWLYDQFFPEIRHLKMEALTTDLNTLGDVCSELTGLTYDEDTLAQFIRHGAINRHRGGFSRPGPRDTFAGWARWQQDMAHVMISSPVLDWLESLGYDLSMFREPAASQAKSGEPTAPCLTDCLRSLDQRHPLLEFMTPAAHERKHEIETDLQGYRLIRHQHQIHAVAKAYKGDDVASLDDATLRRLEDEGLYITGATVAETWRLIAFVLTDRPRLIRDYRGFNIVAYRDKFYAIAQCAPLDLEKATFVEREQLVGQGKLLVSATLDGVKERVRRHRG